MIWWKNKSVLYRRIIDIVENIKIFLSGDKNLDIIIIGENLYVDSDKGISIAIVVNELITNAVKHAFIDRLEGKVIVTISPGKEYSSITVEDNGVGFDVNKIKKSSLGLSLIQLTVREKLKGKIQFLSDENGSKINFDFEN